MTTTFVQGSSAGAASAPRAMRSGTVAPSAAPPPSTAPSQPRRKIRTPHTFRLRITLPWPRGRFVVSESWGHLHEEVDQVLPADPVPLVRPELAHGQHDLSGSCPGCAPGFRTPAVSSPGLPEDRQPAPGAARQPLRDELDLRRAERPHLRLIAPAPQLQVDHVLQQTADVGVAVAEEGVPQTQIPEVGGYVVNMNAVLGIGEEYRIYRYLAGGCGPEPQDA